MLIVCRLYVGRFVGDIGQKTAKTTTILKSISPTLDAIIRDIFGMAGTADTQSFRKKYRHNVNFYFYWTPRPTEQVCKVNRDICTGISIAGASGGFNICSMPEWKVASRPPWNLEGPPADLPTQWKILRRGPGISPRFRQPGGGGTHPPRWRRPCIRVCTIVPTCIADSRTFRKTCRVSTSKMCVEFFMGRLLCMWFLAFSGSVLREGF